MVSAFETFAEVMLVLVSGHVILIAIVTAAIDLRTAVAAASAVSAIVHALVITLAISILDGSLENACLTVIILIVAAVAIGAVPSLLSLTNRLLSLFVCLLLLFDPILFVCPSAVALSIRIHAAKGEDAKAESRGKCDICNLF